MWVIVKEKAGQPMASVHFGDEKIKVFGYNTIDFNKTNGDHITITSDQISSLENAPFVYNIPVFSIKLLINVLYLIIKNKWLSAGTVCEIKVT